MRVWGTSSAAVVRATVSCVRGFQGAQPADLSRQETFLPVFLWNRYSCCIPACVLNNACFPRFNEPGHSSIKTKSALSSVNCLAQLSTDWATPVTNGIGALVAGARITASENFNFEI